MFKTPRFWYKQKSLLSNLLLPAAWLYQGGHIIAQMNGPKQYISTVPVICIGNAIAGGGGKTPMVIALTKLIKETGIYKTPYLLTRGYGSKTSDAVLVDPAIHSADYIGDEPLLLTQHAPTIVSADRKKGAQLAEEKGADIIIMDDGLLNQSLYQDISFLIIDRQIDFGNNRTLPAGPLREPLRKILDLADAVITIGRPFDAADHPIFETTLKADQKPNPDKNYIAFAGIAIPDKFKNSLLDLGYNLKAWFPFPDHHPYSNKDLKKLQKQDGQLITTTKDHVRLPDNIKPHVETLPISIEIKKPESLINFIEEKLKARS